MKRRYQMLLRAPLLAVILFGAGAPITWFGDSVSAASTAQAVLHTGILVVTGTDADDEIVVSANSLTGNLIVANNDVSVPINVVSGSTNRGNTVLVVVFGGDGNDSIALDKSLNNGASPTLGPTANATLIGGSGDDTLTSDFGGFNGGVFNGTVTGEIRGNVVLDGGDGDDILISGFGHDVMLGGNGNDTLRWRPGDLNDVFDGGEGLDTAEIFGNEDLGEVYVIRIDPNQPDQALVQRTSIVKFFVQVRNIEDIALSTLGGNDTIAINDLTGTAVKSVRVNGGAGDDFLNGAAQTNASVELALDGEDGIDFLAGGAGPDTLTG